MATQPTHLCQICKTAPPVGGVGFPDARQNCPGLPDHLRGTCLWVCGSRACDLAAQLRTKRAALKRGIALQNIWRHHIIKSPKG
ncbi:hypothetical protein [Roseobacter litoralis]|uniref:hypothetical protein n=1 Tax=Roseobacter litoralis TaxID=42443 RepID=UPI0024954147|nr:hypothetical protein [Roseobacter litoralis]